MALLLVLGAGPASAQTHTVTTTAGPGGLISPRGPVVLNAGESRTFYVTPNGSMRIHDVKVDGVSVGAVRSHTFDTISADHTISATFDPDTAAVYRGWIPQGIPIITGAGRQWHAVATTDGAGGTIIAWEDSVVSSIVVQRVTASGVRLWGAPGITISGPGTQSLPLIAADGSGGAVVVWTEGIGTGRDVRAQRVDASGTPLWAATGIQVCALAGGQSATDIMADGSGGAFVAWEDARGGDIDVYVQHLDGGGTELWTADGVAVCATVGGQRAPRLSPSAGSAVVVWDDFRAGNWDVYAQRLDTGGSALWTLNGVVVSQVPNDIREARRIVPDGAAGVIVAWTPGTTDHDAYVQRVDSTGARPWGVSGVVLAAFGSEEENCNVTADGAGGAVVTWVDRRSDGGNVYAQRVNSAGVPQWTTNGVLVCGAVNRQDDLAIVSLGIGEVVIAWADGRVAGSAEYDLYAQRLDSTGVAQWTADGVPIATATGSQVTGATSDRDVGGLIPNGAGGWTVVWSDGRNGPSDVYAQRLAFDGTAGFDHVIATAFTPPTGRLQPGHLTYGVGVFNTTSQSFAVLPEAGNHIDNVLVDTVPLGSVASYTFFNLAADHTIVAAFATTPSITSVKPSTGADVGSVTVGIFGVGFQANATVRLTRTAQPDIPGTLVQVSADGRTAFATFNLASKPQGNWNVVIDNPDLSGASLPDGFAVQSGIPQQLQVDILGPDTIRPNRRTAYDIVLENLGNTDVQTLPLFITGIPVAATLELGFPLAAPVPEPGQPDWSLAPVDFPGASGRYVSLVIPRIPPGFTVRRIFITVPAPVTEFDLKVALMPPWQDAAGFLDCLSGLGVGATTCVGVQLGVNAAWLAGAPGVLAENGIGLWAKLAWQCEGATTLPDAITTSKQILDALIAPVLGVPVASGCESALGPRWETGLHVDVVTSVDPNDKIGPSGVGESSQIGADQIMPYSIRFENAETATAPAQQVRITDELDLATLDVSTVSLGPITFGPYTIEPPPGQTIYTATVDLRPDLDLLVEIGANVDPTSGTIGWSLTALDPETGMLPTDAEAGFLPANVLPPEGEGSVMFTVMPVSDLGDGTEIANSATIIFDGAALETPAWSNVVDITPPESEVLPLSPTQSTTTFDVAWHAIGDPPDLRDFSVYVSEDGGEFRAWRVNTAATADTFAGNAQHSYAFYSLARDSSGNLEAVPETPDVETFSTVSAGAGPLFAFGLEGAHPHPVTGRARVWFTLPDETRAVLEILDVAGRRVFSRDVGPLGPGRHAVDVRTATRRPGLYFIRLARGARVAVARMVVVR